MNIHELNEQRIRLEQYVQFLAMGNAYGLTPEQRLASSARYKLAEDALDRAEADYRRALADMTTAELVALTLPAAPDDGE